MEERCPKSPWPQLKSMFALSEMKGDSNIIFECLLCKPKHKFLSCAKTTNANLKKHIQRQHPSQLSNFERLLCKRKTYGSAAPARKQLTIGFEKGVVSQSKLDDLVMSFVVNTSQAFSIVEQPSFVKLVRALAPNCTVLTRRMLMARMEASCDAMKMRLKDTLGRVAYVTVTADCWTTFRRSYLAATVSWLEPSLSRKSAVLLCRRMTGRVTYERIADTLQESFDEYGLRGKVTKVVTDNGANFVKAFRVYGEKNAGDAQHDEEDEVFSEAVEVASLLDSVAADEARLPPHHRCSAHTLNLVATTDALEAERHDIFSRPLKSVLSTCRALWNKQGQSAFAAETIARYCGRSLLRPASTRWNSFFDSLDCLTKLDSAGKDIDGLCRALQVPLFQRPRDVQFMSEYCEVMKPLACAIDVIQKDENMYMGYLLPTITVLKLRLQHLENTGLQYCRPLVHAFLNGIQKRFDHLFDDRELLLASVLIPRFKANWANDPVKREALGEQLRDELSRPCYRGTPATGASSAQNVGADPSDFYSFVIPKASSSGCNSEAFRYLQDAESTSISSLEKYHAVRQAFVRYNTALPSSASVERVFSVAADIFTRKRGKMSDATFESQLLLKTNEV